jgi:hypothetical protein
MLSGVKKIRLTQGKYALVDIEDFNFLNQWKWYFAHGYAYRKFWNKKKQKNDGIFLHQLINRTSKGFYTDHINRNRLDNRKNNLRSVTPHQNSFNLSVSKNNKSGYKGVYWFKRDGKWKVQIKVDGRQIHLGVFSNIKNAVLARKKAERIYHAM